MLITSLSKKCEWFSSITNLKRKIWAVHHSAKKAKGPNQKSSSKLIPVELDPSPPSGFQIGDLPNLSPEVSKEKTQWIEKFEPLWLTLPLWYALKSVKRVGFFQKWRPFWTSQTSCCGDAKRQSEGLGAGPHRLSAYFSVYVCIYKHVYYIYMTWIHGICFRYSMSIVNRNLTDFLHQKPS